ncbi:hypothetical protein [Cetobacterium sp.]|uniref:hypothetical protein n=1 Tax=Cetobacterium sp. TaxID=2071632 RepID=UPI003EE5C01B
MKLRQEAARYMNVRMIREELKKIKDILPVDYTKTEVNKMCRSEMVHLHDKLREEILKIHPELLKGDY